MFVLVRRNNSQPKSPGWRAQVAGFCLSNKTHMISSVSLGDCASSSVRRHKVKRLSDFNYLRSAA